MPKTTHADLVLHILRYVTETVAEGDLHAVADLGFRLDQVARLERFALRDLSHLSRISTHFLNVTVDASCLDKILEHMERGKDREALQEELIRLRAPLAMMRTLFGMSNAEYAARRKLLGMSGAGVGRPPAPSEEEEHRVWHAWQDNAALPDEERFLNIGRTLGVSLTVVWALVRSWAASGLAPATKPHQAAEGGGKTGAEAGGGTGAGAVVHTLPQRAARG